MSVKRLGDVLSLFFSKCIGPHAVFLSFQSDFEPRVREFSLFFWGGIFFIFYFFYVGDSHEVSFFSDGVASRIRGITMGWHHENT